MFAYVGSRTTRERNARGDGISVFHFDPVSGALDLVQVVGELLNPSFLTLNRSGDVLYTVHGDHHEVSAFRVDRPTGRLTRLNTQDCQGKNPVHLALDPSGQHMVVSNHITGTLAVLPVAEDGTLRPVSQLVTLEGKPGPHRTEQPFAKPHFNPFSPCGRWVLVPDKGLDKVFVFSFEDGRLLPAAQPHLDLREGAGPRHLAFHPTQPWVYVVNELDNTVTSCHFDAKTGALQAFQIVPTLADSFTGNSRAAEIEVHPAGHTLYASNRGEDSIAVFSIDPATGRLARRQTQPTTGKTPRFFKTDPSGSWLFVLNEDSDQIVRFAACEDGTIKSECDAWTCGSPVCLVIAL
jgi:6-phosphogluconolactonase (cycloisomerase 2 family)